MKVFGHVRGREVPGVYSESDADEKDCKNGAGDESVFASVAKP